MMIRTWLLVTLVCTAACGARPAPAAPSQPSADIDTLDYVLGDASTWPRRGTQRQHQIVDFDKREVCWVKYGRPDMFECWRWDDAWIYHEVDHAIDGGAGTSYTFSDGRWLPRHLASNRVWTLDVRRNAITWRTQSCAVDASRSHAFPYRQRAWIEPARTLSDDLGARQILVLQYEPYDPAGGPTHPERFSFAQGAGWFAWSSDRGQALFDRFGGRAVNRTAACGDVATVAGLNPDTTTLRGFAAPVRKMLK
jgi:hypothetical protein